MSTFARSIYRLVIGTVLLLSCHWRGPLRQVLMSVLAVKIAAASLRDNDRLAPFGEPE